MGAKNILLSKQGSTAIILSLMVSTGVLGTIYFTQKMSGSFLSRSAQTMEDWEKYLVTESAQVMAAYMVSNNLVMCREGGWKDKASKCRWSTVEKTNSPSAFNLSEESDSEKGLSYIGTYTLGDNDRKYKITFNLVDYRDTSIENMIGEVPEAVCRDKSNFAIIKGATCKDYSEVEYEKPTELTKLPSEVLAQPCQREGSNVPNSFCEYVRPVDDDNWIVLLKVEVDYKDPILNLDKKHIAFSGVRRPLSFIQFGDIISGRRCSMSCPVGKQLNPFSDCRGDAIPSEEGSYTGKASNIVTVRNKGPGSIYSLALVRSSVKIVDPDALPQTDIVQDIVKKAGLEVFLPGEEIKFEYFYDCPITVKKTTVYETGDEDNVKVTVRNQMVPFERFTYGFLFDSKNPIGVCYKESNNPPDLEATNIDGERADFVIVRSDENHIAAPCGLGDSTCSANGKTGTCQFVHLEPKRTFTIMNKYVDEYKALVRTIETKITEKEKVVVASGGDGGDGADGTGDGAGCCGPGSW